MRSHAAALALILCANAAGPVAAEPLRLLCTHPFAPEHPLVAGFLDPWAHGITVDSRGALEIEIVSSASPGPDCGLAPVSGIEADAMALPFALFTDAERSSRAIHAVFSTHDRVPGLLAAAALGHDLVAAGPEAPFPLPGGIEDQVIAAPSDAVGGVLAFLGAQLAGPDGPEPTARLAPLAAEAAADWVVTFDAGRSLYTVAYALTISPDRMEQLPAAIRALVTQVDGADLSAAAGRALDRAHAVALEAAQARGTRVALLEDRVGDALSEADLVSRDWATQGISNQAAYVLLGLIRQDPRNRAR